MDEGRKNDLIYASSSHDVNKFFKAEQIFTGREIECIDPIEPY